MVYFSPFGTSAEKTTRANKQRAGYKREREQTKRASELQQQCCNDVLHSESESARAVYAKRVLESSIAHNTKSKAQASRRVVICVVSPFGALLSLARSRCLLLCEAGGRVRQTKARGGAARMIRVVTRHRRRKGEGRPIWDGEDGSQSETSE